MFPSFIITFREVIEATVIVATILGVISKLKWKEAVSTVWKATGIAVMSSVFLIGAASVFGFKIQQFYTGRTEEIIEGILMIVSAIFITWAVFFLHTFFSRQKGHLMQQVKKTVQTKELKGLFVLVFTAVFREGFEIALFLSSIYLSTKPSDVLFGFMGGLIGGLIVSFLFFRTTERLPIQYAFRISGILLILFAGGLIARGIHEFAEAHIIPELFMITFAFIPDKASFMGGIIKALFGITQKMDIIPIVSYISYVLGMGWFIFFRPNAIQVFHPSESK
ncbi:MAG: FTR1 family protein [Microgenomates group bacterium]